MNTKGLFFIIFVAMFVISSCQKENKSKPKDIVVQQQDDQRVYPMPTPFEVTQMIQSSGISYNMGVTNDVKNASKYLSEKAQALNLGIYGADLAYAATYNQAQATRDILDVSEKLSDELNITDVLNKNIVDRIENNIQNADSLYKIVNHSFIETYNKLYKQGKGGTALTVIAGAWIESLYIATQLAIAGKNDSDLITKVAQQKFNFDNLTNLLVQNKDQSSYLPDVIKYISELKPVFDNVKVDEDGNVSMSKKDFQDLTKLVQDLRQQIISLQ